MGLYSLNRVAGLTENAYINKSLIESMDDSNNFTETSLLEVSQIITEHENKMFNTLIELDFVSAMNEAEEAKAEKKDDAPADDKKETKSEADDAKKKNILQKAKELLEKVWEAIKNAFMTFLAKIRILLNNDKKIIDKYVPALKKVDDFSKYEKEFEYYDGEVPSFGITLFDAVNKDNAEETVKKFKEDCDKFKTGKLTKAIVDKAIEVISGKTFETFKSKASALKANVAAKLEGKEGDAYEIANAQAKAAKECAAIYVKTIKKVLMDNRTILILAGKWALANAGKKEEKAEDKKDEKAATTDTNEAFDFALIEASNLYVTECLEF